jgi:addiction module HigA family antidote
VIQDCLGQQWNQLAKNLGITATRLNDIVRGRRGVTADTALRLAQYLGTSASFWMGLQLEYDLRTAQATAGANISKQVKPMKNQAA